MHFALQSSLLLFAKAMVFGTGGNPAKCFALLALGDFSYYIKYLSNLLRDYALCFAKFTFAIRKSNGFWYGRKPCQMLRFARAWRFFLLHKILKQSLARLCTLLCKVHFCCSQKQWLLVRAEILPNASLCSRLAIFSYYIKKTSNAFLLCLLNKYFYSYLERPSWAQLWMPLRKIVSLLSL